MYLKNFLRHDMCVVSTGVTTAGLLTLFSIWPPLPSTIYLERPAYNWANIGHQGICHSHYTPVEGCLLTFDQMMLCSALICVFKTEYIVPGVGVGGGEGALHQIPCRGSHWAKLQAINQSYRHLSNWCRHVYIIIIYRHNVFDKSGWS